MKIGNVLCLMVLGAFTLSFLTADAYNYVNRNVTNPYFARDSRYDYLYANPPKPGLRLHGRHFIMTSGVRYSHSPSKLKGAKHAARINAYNMQAMGY